MIFKKKNMIKEVKPKARNPLDLFFSLGEKATKGDPLRKANFDYYMLWIMFIAFSTILISNFSGFLELVKINFMASLKSLGWSGVMCAILWFQYHALGAAKMVRDRLKNLKSNKIEIPKVELTKDTKEEMLEDFK